MELKKTVRINALLDAYGNLLTAHQQEIMQEYYGSDMSLAELAEAHKVSRNAIFSLVKKCEKSLQEYETKLHWLQKQTQLRKVLDESKLSQKELVNKIAQIYDIK